MKLKDISNKFGLTKTEFNVFLTLVLVFLFGLSLKLVKQNNSRYNSVNFFYNDSVFYSYAGRDLNNENISVKGKVNSSYKQYVLEINNSSQKHIDKSHIVMLININSAKIDELIKLPGIGEKTAEKIIELRNRKGKFIKIDELKEVKGIGKVKFSKIKEFIFIK